MIGNASGFATLVKKKQESHHCHSLLYTETGTGNKDLSRRSQKKFCQDPRIINEDWTDLGISLIFKDLFPNLKRRKYYALLEHMEDIWLPR